MKLFRKFVAWLKNEPGEVDPVWDDILNSLDEISHRHWKVLSKWRLRQERRLNKGIVKEYYGPL